MTSVLNRMLCLLAVPFVFVLQAQDASAQETAKGLLATQARAQGYPCDKPISARKYAKRSRPDRSLLGSSLRTQVLHDAADTGHGRAYSASEVATQFGFFHCGVRRAAETKFPRLPNINSSETSP